MAGTSPAMTAPPRAAWRLCETPTSHRRPPQIVGVGAVDPDGRDVARPQGAPRRDMDRAVDLRRVALGAALGEMLAALVDHDLEAPADFGREFPRADRLLAQHEPLVAHSLYFVRHGLEAEIVGLRALDRLVLEGADAVEPGFVQPVEQQLEILLRLAGKADDEGRADRDVRANCAPRLDALEGFLLIARAAHRLQHPRRRVLEGHVDIGQHIAAVHQLHDLIDMRIGVDIVQPHPGAERAELAYKVEEARGDVAVAPPARGVLQIAAVGAGVLRNDKELLDARPDQLFRFAQHLARGPRHKVAAQSWNDAEAAAVVAALGDLEIGVVARRQLDALLGDEVHER